MKRKIDVLSVSELFFQVPAILINNVNLKVYLKEFKFCFCTEINDYFVYSVIENVSYNVNKTWEYVYGNFRIDFGLSICSSEATL